ncbi:SDR family NAD(P)-dependent oxidoreductase [Paenibacillus thalictri]|uniref:SDR family oxidoreductase n=1 Tax=Paenibacillus thalictri TaxID=2527873 RepID=A0A4Q9DWI0_9BACL|nr:SDR family NAD(P)-dependent oxidoreductase [Paenibacillus thalictri]TBL80705.1 SDR family oxidoreductase [Paenibacillus thalictri]
MLLQGKTALITGAAKGIGRAIAERFADEGGRVIVTDVLSDEGAAVASRIVRNGGMAEFAALDVTDEATVANVFSGIPQLDILINNAGITPSGSLAHISLEDWNRTLAVNLTSVFLCCKYALPLLQCSGAPSIVNMSSINSFDLNPGLPAYAASKGAIVSLTQQLAVEYGAQRIRVNCISPGLTQKEQPGEGMDPQKRDILLDCYPLGRIGEYKDVANAALFLASELSAFVNGVDLVVDGGMSLQSVSALLRPDLRKRWKSGTYKLEK